MSRKFKSPLRFYTPKNQSKRLNPETAVSRFLQKGPYPLAPLTTILFKKEKKQRKSSIPLLEKKKFSQESTFMSSNHQTLLKGCSVLLEYLELLLQLPLPEGPRSIDNSESYINKYQTIHARYMHVVRESTCSYSRSNFRNSSLQLSTMLAKLFRFFTGFPLKARTYTNKTKKKKKEVELKGDKKKKKKKEGE